MEPNLEEGVRLRCSIGENPLLAMLPDSDRGAASRAWRKRAGRQRGFEVLSENRLKAATSSGAIAAS